METKSFTTLDKSEWGDGEWRREPDKMQWPDEKTGLACLAVRGGHGGWCGYVGVGSAHPLHRLGYSDKIQTVDKELLRRLLDDRGALDLYADDLDGEGVSPESVLSCHGGITFADDCADMSREEWQRVMDYLPTKSAEAVNFPRGDAARFIKINAPFKNDYDAWRAHKQATSICHIPAAGEPDDVWWFGFDCAHSGDHSPAYDKDYGLHPDSTYRTLEYVQAECRDLARQLALFAEHGASNEGKGGAAAPEPH